jgi:hypothetical protein
MDFVNRLFVFILESVFYHNELPDSKYKTSITGKILRYKNISLNYMIKYKNKISDIKFDINCISTRDEIFNFLKNALELESYTITSTSTSTLSSTLTLT